MCLTDYAPDTQAFDLDRFSPDASQNSSHLDGSSEPAREHHHVDQVAGASSFNQQEYKSEMNVGAQESPRTTANAAKKSCNCIDSALRLLEALEIKTSIVNARTVDQILCFGKQALMECNRLLECQACVASSSFIMLLVVICQKLVLVFEELVHCISNEERISHKERRETWNSLSKESTASLGAFRIDTQEEWWGVFGTLTILQFRSLEILLDQLKLSAASWGWETHSAMLRLSESQIQKATCILLKAMQSPPQMVDR